MKLYILWFLCLLYLPEFYADFNFQKNINVLDTSVNITSEDVLDIQLSVQLISRGTYAISGHFELKIELDDRQYFDLKILYNEKSASKYKMLFDGFPNNTLTEFMNAVYKPVLMETLQECNPSFPLFEQIWSPPLEPFRADMKKCTFTMKQLPTFAPNGYFKLVVTGTGLIAGVAEITVLVD